MFHLDTPHEIYHPILSIKNFVGLRRPLLDSFYLLCSLAQESVKNSVHIFLTSTMLTNQLQSEADFTNEINNTITQFQKKTLITFAQTLDLIRMNAQGNTFLSMFLLNWNIEKIGHCEMNNISFVHAPVFSNDGNQNSSCSCATLRTCTAPVTGNINGELFVVTGLKLGCHFLETVLLSSFSCFYSPICINNFRSIFSAPPFDSIDGIQLNEILTRFNINDTFERIAYEMFIESWKSNVSYEDYFNSCSPNYCIHTKYYRFDTVEILTTFLSVFGGISIGIRLLVPYLAQIFQRVSRCFRCTR